MAKLPIGPTPDVGDGSVAADAPETKEMEIWWEDNFERADSGTLTQALSVRYGDDPVARYEDPDWAQFYNGSADRPALHWSEDGDDQSMYYQGVFSPNYLTKSVIENGDIVHDNRGTTPGDEYTGLASMRTTVPELRIPGDFQILVSFSWTNVTASSDYYVDVGSIRIGIHYPDVEVPDPDEDSDYYHGPSVGFFHSWLHLQSGGAYIGTPDINPSAFIVFDDLPADGNPTYHQLNSLPVPKTAVGIDGPNLIKFGLEDGEWTMAIAYPDTEDPYEASFPAQEYTYSFGEAGSPSIAMLLVANSQDFSDPLPYDFDNVQPIKVHQVRVVKPLQGPYKGASLGARKRPGSPVLDTLSDPWRGIDYLPDYLDVNYYGDNGIPDYAAYTDPLDAESPVRG